MVDKLHKYNNNEINCHSLNMILCSDFNVYKNIGKYIVKKYGGLDNLPNYFHIPSKNDVNYISVAITFFTTILNDEVLLKLYNEPIYHDEFGEGFEGIYNKELDEYEDPENNFSYASYFVEINDIEYHIGYDHRGTNIEILYDGDNTPPIKNVVDSVITLVDKVMVYCK